PSVEDQTILFMEAQDRLRSYEENALIQNGPRVEGHTILFMEAQDRPSVEEQTILIMEAQDRLSVEEHTILFMEAQDRPSVEERAILFMEAQDRVKKKPLFKMRNSSSETPFQAHDQSIRSLERGCLSVEEQTILFMEAQDRPSVEERAILFMEAQDRVKKKCLFKMRNSSSETPFQTHDQSIRILERGCIMLKYGITRTRSQSLDFRPMTSQFESWNGEVLCKNVSLIDSGPSFEEQTKFFMEAQDRPSVEEQTILFMEAQDRMMKRPLFKMA
ncbi:hypothetical protein Tco_0979543, partial [Tanacetum coccineum]